MKFYTTPELTVSYFDIEGIMIVSGTTAPVQEDIGQDLLKEGYEFVSDMQQGSSPEVKAGAAFSWK